ncbi:Rv2231c family pyridoxal phosphate-dependent protein CobC [Haloactinomyces albus]|uniref:Aminotransferase n=1 Tax=Haloactinomyces albus TaxID=1352928 RepID=A0AAE3Z9I9_9ACTN|nr:Rv2231c family pyridoxal phosphate-dependent protein CobC [Haloactinomyces albus]MDR7300828.1 histidinol-phosphate aminotransferase [Haloactinomyces albus]
MTSRDDRELLRHHGDIDAEPGLLDFAVNVRLDRPPPWLHARLTGALDRLGHYPSGADEAAARSAVAARHGRPAEDVLLLAGAAECFALLPSLRPRLAAVVHPSFTEPEFALRSAGVPITRVPLAPEDGYRLRPEAVPDEADMVVLGNPTNPTSVLHPAETIRLLARPGRVLVVDEAFADAVPGEPESLAASRLPGVLVVRSLTKMWGLPGLRAGYALAEPELLAELAAHRPHWPLGTLALEAITACCGSGALAESEEAATRIAAHREVFAADLDALADVHVHGPAAAPFLLLRIAGGERVREELRGGGIAVRRGDTFPGLDTDHVRVSVRAPEENSMLVEALRGILGPGRSSTEYPVKGATA